MIKDLITLDEVIEFLNELIKIDQRAMHKLIKFRTPCNQELADHESIQVTMDLFGFEVGLLGILNGLFGVDEDKYGAITAVFDETGLIAFRRTVRRDRITHGETAS